MDLAQLRVADELDDGGQAKVFALADDASLVLKRYHDPDHSGLQPGTLHILIGLRQGLRAMGWGVDAWAAWPIEPVEDRGRLVGFLMPRVSGEFMLVVGGKEQESGTVAVRARHRDDPGVTAPEDLARMMLDEIARKV